MSDRFAPEPVKGGRTHNNAAPDAFNLGVLAALANAAAPTLVEGNQTLLSVDLTGRLRTLAEISGSVQVTPDGNPNAVANPFWTRLTDGTAAIGVAGNPLVVTTTDTNGTPEISVLTHADLATGASQVLKADDVTTANLGYLCKVTASSSIRFKCVIQTVVAGTPETIAVLFGDIHNPVEWKPGDPMNTELLGAVGSAYQVTLTNLDNQFAADMYATIEWNEVA